jgi:hypothetical protein
VGGSVGGGGGGEGWVSVEVSSSLFTKTHRTCDTFKAILQGPLPSRTSWLLG